MTQELAIADFEITALALQHCGLEVDHQMTGADRRAVGNAEKLIRLYLMRTDIERRWILQHQADVLGCSVATVKRWAGSDEFQKVAAFMAPPSRSPMVEEGKELYRKGLT